MPLACVVLVTPADDRARLEIDRVLRFVRRMRPTSFILAIFASGSCGCIQSSFEPFFLRFRSIRARPARVGVLMPAAAASGILER